MLAENGLGRQVVSNHRETRDQARKLMLRRQEVSRPALREEWSDISEALGNKFVQAVNDRVAPC